ncbi:MAG: PIN domain-containing protein [Candidatus Latescibacteria bacterium]|nr:PIN domain-containing protein [Candidatus Latescibacterota bacterium]
MNAVDTNVLLYAHDARDAAKQATAVSLIRSLTDGVLLWQVACEYISASRKLESLGYNRQQAWQDINDLRQLWTTVLPSWDVLNEAQQLLGRYNLSLWDAMIIAACLKQNISRLYSEDFDAYPKIDGMEVINPFRGL